MAMHIQYMAFFVQSYKPIKTGRRGGGWLNDSPCQIRPGTRVIETEKFKGDIAPSISCDILTIKFSERSRLTGSWGTVCYTVSFPCPSDSFQSTESTPFEKVSWQASLPTCEPQADIMVLGLVDSPLGPVPPGAPHRPVGEALWLLSLCPRSPKLKLSLIL